MYKACSRCGKIHEANYVCTVGKPRYSSAAYKTDADMPRYTKSWEKKSKEIREASNYLCAVCATEGIYNYKDLEVHHITKLRDDPSKLLDDDNLICLCRMHHRLADEGYIDADYLRELAKLRDNAG